MNHTAQPAENLKHLRDLLGDAADLLRDRGVEVQHCCQVARLAGWLFDQTTDLHGLGDAERALLLAAALLHDLGVSISYAGHHKHSQALILRASLPRTDHRARLIIANLARYHRKRGPEERHPHFAALAPADRNLVRQLAALLRIADGLDRTHTNAVTALRIRPVAPGRWRLAVSGRGSLSEELWATREKKKDLFEEVFGTSLEIARANGGSPP